MHPEEQPLRGTAPERRGRGCAAHLLVVVADGDGCGVGEHVAEARGLVLVPKAQDVLKELVRASPLACFGKLLQQGGHGAGVQALYAASRHAGHWFPWRQPPAGGLS